MSRVTFIRQSGEAIRLEPDAYPLAIGGPEAVIDVEGTDEVLAYIGESEGHVFVQSVQTHTTVWHRHEQLEGSAWLKSGDRVQIGTLELVWSVQGEQAFIDVLAAESREVPETVTTAPLTPPPLYEPELPAAQLAAPKRTGLMLGLVALFGVLLLVSVYVLLATPFKVGIEPAPDTMSVEGFPPPFSLGGRSMALAGEYRLKAEKSGYVPLDTTFQVATGAANAFSFTMLKKPGRVDLSSNPEGAQLNIDGEPVGNAPFKALALGAGNHELHWQAPGYLPLTTSISVVGMDEEQQFRFELEKNSAPVSITSRPAGATIHAGDDVLGVTPATLDLAGGEHQIRLELEGYEPHALSVTVLAKQPQDLGEIQLNKPSGVLKLSGKPDGMTVMLNGEYLGTTPLDARLAPEQEHVLRFSKAGFQTASRKVSLESASEKPLTIRLKPEYGVVFFQAFPADARLFIDGQDRGPASTRLKLPTRSHRVEIRKSGYKSHVATVTPKAGSSQTLKIRLQSGKKKTPKATQAKLTTKDGQTLIRLDPKTTVTLGASRREQGRRANERQRKVTFKRAFYVAEKEVTNTQFKLHKATHNSGAGDANLGDRPVATVSWDDAARYLNALSKQDGLPEAFEEVEGKMRLKRPVNTGYRFPTEAEWAYAARFAKRSSADKYPWSGNKFPPFNPSGNYADSTAQGSLGAVLGQYTDGFAASAPVGSFRPNAAGFYDIGGNVAEWCLDYYAVTLTGGSKAETDPVGPVNGRHHVVRGSSWKDATITELRLSYRDYSDKPREDLGFRVARYAE